MEYLYIFLWYLSGCLASYLLWRIDAKDRGIEYHCPSPVGILAGLAFAAMGAIGLIAVVIVLIIFWFADDHGDSWWTRPVCRK